MWEGEEKSDRSQAYVQGMGGGGEVVYPPPMHTCELDMGEKNSTCNGSVIQPSK